jgi:GT2 family glycosyltransferase
MVLDGLDRQTTLPEQFEVLVICDGCTDDTVAVCRSRAVSYALRIIEQTPNQGPAAARNRGVEAAKAPLILFIDDDVVPEPTLIAEHLRLHQTDERAVVIGPLLAPAGFRLNPWTGWEEAMLEKQYRAMSARTWEPTPRQFYTGNASVRREHILKAGGFDASFRRAEDVELAFRFKDLGLHFYFNPEAKGWHHALRSLRSWLNIPTAYGWADVAMSRSGREVILRRMAKEFLLRQRPLQRLARLCVGRAWLLRPVVGALLVTASLAAWTGQQGAAYGAYSAIFNLRYWQSVCAQLGGAPAFWALVQQHAGTPR